MGRGAHGSGKHNEHVWEGSPCGRGRQTHPSVPLMTAPPAPPCRSGSETTAPSSSRLPTMVEVYRLQITR